MVEDDPSDREIFAIALEQVDGVEAEMFSAGIDAIDRLEAGDIPDVLFLDLGLPDMSGAEIIAQIREMPATATLPIVMLSSSTDLDRVDHAYRNGANVYFQKPDSITATANLFAHTRDHWSRALLPADHNEPSVQRI